MFQKLIITGIDFFFHFQYLNICENNYRISKKNYKNLHKNKYYGLLSNSRSSSLSNIVEIRRSKKVKERLILGK